MPGAGGMIAERLKVVGSITDATSSFPRDYSFLNSLSYRPWNEKQRCELTLWIPGLKGSFGFSLSADLSGTGDPIVILTKRALFCSLYSLIETPDMRSEAKLGPRPACQTFMQLPIVPQIRKMCFQLWLERMLSFCLIVEAKRR